MLPENAKDTMATQPEDLSEETSAEAEGQLKQKVFCGVVVLEEFSGPGAEAGKWWCKMCNRTVWLGPHEEMAQWDGHLESETHRKKVLEKVPLLEWIVQMPTAPAQTAAPQVGQQPGLVQGPVAPQVGKRPVPPPSSPPPDWPAAPQVGQRPVPPLSSPPSCWPPVVQNPVQCPIPADPQEWPQKWPQEYPQKWQQERPQEWQRATEWQHGQQRGWQGHQQGQGSSTSSRWQGQWGGQGWTPS